MLPCDWQIIWQWACSAPRFHSQIHPVLSDGNKNTQHEASQQVFIIYSSSSSSSSSFSSSLFGLPQGIICLHVITANPVRVIQYGIITVICMFDFRFYVTSWHIPPHLCGLEIDTRCTPAYNCIKTSKLSWILEDVIKGKRRVKWHW